MRVAILGGTGGVGRWLMAIARENGDHVKTLVRDRAKLPRDLGAVGVIEGDALDRDAVDTTVAGCDVVFSALGAGGLGATTLYSRSAEHLVAAMRRNAISRVLAISSAGVEDDPHMNIFARRIVMPLVLGKVLRDMALMEEVLSTSGLVYTIVRPGRLTDGPRTGLYRANDRFVPEGGRAIARADERAVRKITALTY